MRTENSKNIIDINVKRIRNKIDIWMAFISFMIGNSSKTKAPSLAPMPPGANMNKSPIVHARGSIETR